MLFVIIYPDLSYRYNSSNTSDHGDRLVFVKKKIEHNFYIILYVLKSIKFLDLSSYRPVLTQDLINVFNFKFCNVFKQFLINLFLIFYLLCNCISCVIAFFSKTQLRV